MGCQCWCCLGQLVTNRWWVCSPPDQDERKGKEGSPIRGKEERSERWDGGNWGGGNQVADHITIMDRVEVIKMKDHIYCWNRPLQLLD